LPNRGARYGGKVATEPDRFLMIQCFSKTLALVLLDFQVTNPAALLSIYFFKTEKFLDSALFVCVCT
jgi:hypothetical protein